MRELALMAEARGKDNWEHTSAIMALLANVNRNPKKHGPFAPSDFNPYRQERRQVLKGKPGLKMLRSVFVKGKGKKA